MELVRKNLIKLFHVKYSAKVIFQNLQRACDAFEKHSKDNLSSS